MNQKYLTAKLIYAYLKGDEKLEKLIIFNPDNIVLNTTDQSLYEAVGSMDRDKIVWAKLVKLLENVNVHSYKTVLKKNRTILTDARAESVRGGVNYARQEN